MTLSPQLGGGIDGAWWPHSSAVATELPDLVSALHRPLGEIDAIRVNWSETDGQLDLETMAAGSRLMLPGEHHRKPRLMAVIGSEASASLLVIPTMTSQALGTMVMRTAAGLPTSVGSGDGRLYETACVVMSLAKAESAKWRESA